MRYSLMFFLTMFLIGTDTFLGETLAGVIGGILFRGFPGYLGISLFSVSMIVIALFLYAKSGIFDTKTFE